MGRTKTKFKIGQLVRCVENPTARLQHNSTGMRNGVGWRKDLIFKITQITHADGVIYWPGRSSCGVYEEFIAPVETEWDEETNHANNI